MQEWWVNMNRNGGSTWSGIYKRLNRIKNHINSGEFKYPSLSAEENSALRIITNNLYESVKNEFAQAAKLFEDLNKAYTKK
jgi:hypothetical protein